MRSIIEFTRLNEFAVIFIAFVLAFALVDLVVEPIQHQFVSCSVNGGQLTVHSAWHPCPCGMALRCTCHLTSDCC